VRDLLLRREGKGKGGGKAKGEKCGRGKFCAVIIFQSEKPWVYPRKCGHQDTCIRWKSRSLMGGGTFEEDMCRPVEKYLGTMHTRYCQPYSLGDSSDAASVYQSTVATWFNCAAFGWRAAKIAYWKHFVGVDRSSRVLRSSNPAWNIDSDKARSCPEELDVTGSLATERASDPQDAEAWLELPLLAIRSSSAFCDGTSRYGVPENLTTG